MGCARRRRGILCPGAERQERHRQPGQCDETEFHGRYPLSPMPAANRLYSRRDGKLLHAEPHNSRDLVMTAPSLDSLPTPCLLLDQARLARNAERMRARTAGLGVSFRPHLKTAKSVDAATFILGSPPGPATVSTLKEAEIFGAARHHRPAVRGLHQPAETRPRGPPPAKRRRSQDHPGLHRSRQGGRRSWQKDGRTPARADRNRCRRSSLRRALE